MVAPGVEHAIVTVTLPEYDPPSGLNVGISIEKAALQASKHNRQPNNGNINLFMPLSYISVLFAMQNNLQLWFFTTST